MIRVLLFGTHPKQFNGYSKVVYELAKVMSTMTDIELTIYGFQNFYSNAKHRLDLPKNVSIYDAYANENPKTSGFGIHEIQSFVTLLDPDVCIVYNDMLVITQVVTELRKVPNARFKVIGYIDQVYLNQKKMFIDFINKHIDVAVLFTKHWQEVIVKQGLKVPNHFLPHGFNPMQYYPVPKHLARQYFNVDANEFIILNLNRNQPRKRWDICLKAFAEVVSQHPSAPIKMIIGTALQGAWDLLEIYERELSKRDLTLEVGMKHIIILENPQHLSDEEINILYNVADIGINTCDGEGFGLCNFEQAGVGIPQVVTRLGGFIDYFNDENAMLVDPVLAYYVDNTRDMVCGEALFCSYTGIVDGIVTYYKNKDLRLKHGSLVRSNLLKNYSWSSISLKLCDIIKSIIPKQPEVIKGSISVQTINGDIEEIDDATLSKLCKAVEEKQNETSNENKNEMSINKLDNIRKQSDVRKEVLELQKRLNELMSLIDNT